MQADLEMDDTEMVFPTFHVFLRSHRVHTAENAVGSM